jgi:hypothetical protein
VYKTDFEIFVHEVSLLPVLGGLVSVSLLSTYVCLSQSAELKGMKQSSVSDAAHLPFYMIPAFQIIMYAYFIMVLDMLLLVTDNVCSFPGSTLVYTVYKCIICHNMKGLSFEENVANNIHH